MERLKKLQHTENELAKMLDNLRHELHKVDIEWTQLCVLSLNQTSDAKDFESPKDEAPNVDDPDVINATTLDLTTPAKKLQSDGEEFDSEDENQ